MNQKRMISIFIFLAVCGLGITQYPGHVPNKDTPIAAFIEEVEKGPSFLTKSPEEGLLEALEYYGVQHPEIVYAQAILETGNFKSALCVNNNNLFGLYDSNRGRYYTYSHWSESVKDYVDCIQYKYKPPNNYYKFLSDIGYAKDPNYIKKLKVIVNDKRRSE